ncbi:MAG TPA: rod shape-determining protein RodA [Acidimicrobiales bacterium]|nr:rod shape-determining protein RodA [Acidimicrobiales bacterium]
MDVVLVFAALLAASIGVIMVYSATRGNLLAQGLDPHYFLKRQALFVMIGIVAMVVAALIDYRRIESVGMLVYGLLVLALLGVLVPGVGSHVLGSARWFSLGPLQIQPSEFAVIALIIAVATYCSRRSEGLTWKDVIKVLVLAGIPVLLVMKQPDLGTAIIMMIVLLAMLAVAGVPGRVLVILVVVGAVSVVLALKVGLLHQYQLNRLTTFLHQDSHNPALQGSIYNVNQAKIAIGSGGLWGKGFLHGAQTNLGYVPFQQTDFIFTAVGEQLGFVGATVVLAILGIIAWRILRAAQLARDSFGRLLCAGIFTFFAYSVFQNAGMTMGIMPITGIPLPFLSYGGSAALVFFIGVGIALSVYARRAA